MKYVEVKSQPPPPNTIIRGLDENNQIYRVIYNAKFKVFVNQKADAENRYPQIVKWKYF